MELGESGGRGGSGWGRRLTQTLSITLQSPMVSRFVRWEAWIVDCSFSLNSSLQYLITSEVLPTRPVHANRADGQLARPAPARGRGSGGALGAGVWGVPGAGAWARAPSPNNTILRDRRSILSP